MKNFEKIVKLITCVMCQEVKKLATKVENLNLISGSHIQQEWN